MTHLALAIFYLQPTMSANDFSRTGQSVVGTLAFWPLDVAAFCFHVLTCAKGGPDSSGFQRDFFLLAQASRLGDRSSPCWLGLFASVECGSFGCPVGLKFSVFQPSPASKFIQGYLGAVISAVSIAVSTVPDSPHFLSVLLLFGCPTRILSQTCLRVRPV